MEGLVAGVRSAGHDVRSEVHGSPRPLTPERYLVAYHVLQEMLTNTLKHGRRDRPISVERTWSDDALRIQVRNSIAESGAGAGVDGSSTGPQGVGLQGMRRRLAAVGGRLSVDVGEVGPDLEPEYTATAWIPGGPEAATDA
jgi:signal transduction histidine kinase